MVDKLLYIFTKIGQKLSKVSLVKALQSLSVTTAKHSNDVKVKLPSLKLKKLVTLLLIDNLAGISFYPLFIEKIT